MNIKDYIEKHNNRTLMDQEWEHLAQNLLNAKFDAEKKAQWAQKLRENGVHRTVSGSLRLSSVNIRKFMAAASVLLVLFAAGWYFFLKNPLTNGQAMAKAYLQQPFRLDPGTRRGEESTEITRGMAYAAYEMKQYDRALTYLRIIESEGQPKAADFFQMGLCLMYQKEPDYARAINAFNAAQKLDPAKYPDEINWFSGLCYLMTGNNQAAAVSLQKVVDSPSSRDNQEAAKVLLRKLKQ
jgi:tetratricopeptide (TPR) repeat protein